MLKSVKGSRAFTFVVAVLKAQSRERIGLSAAAVAFWAAIAVTPAFIAVSIIFGRIVDPQVLDEAVESLKSLAPDSLGSLLANQLQAAANATTSQVSWGLAISLVTVLWAVSSGIYAFQRAVRLAYGLDPQHYVSARVLAYVGSLTSIVVLGILLIGAGAGSAWASTLDEPWRALAFTIGTVAGLGLGTGILTAFFRTAALHEAPRFNWPGAAFGAVASLAVVIGFGIYLRFATSYQAIYGTLASTVILSLVLYICAYVILIGAIGNAELSRTSPGDQAPSRASNSPA
jgi:membrane protein